MDGRQTRRWLHNCARGRSTSSPPDCQHLNHMNSPSIKRESVNTDESDICPAAKCRAQEDISATPRHADASDQGWGDRNAWGRPKVTAQTDSRARPATAYPATHKREETQPALKLSLQRVKSLSLVPFFKPHSPARAQVRHCSPCQLELLTTAYRG